jgi:hypothetical protein
MTGILSVLSALGAVFFSALLVMLLAEALDAAARSRAKSEKFISDGNLRIWRSAN